MWMIKWRFLWSGFQKSIKSLEQWRLWRDIIYIYIYNNILYYIYSVFPWYFSQVILQHLWAFFFMFSEVTIIYLLFMVTLATMEIQFGKFAHLWHKVIFTFHLHKAWKKKSLTWGIFHSVQAQDYRIFFLLLGGKNFP